MRPGFVVKYSIPKVELSVVFRNLTDNAAGISGGNMPVGNVFCDNAACADYHIAADMDAGADYGIAANPHIVANLYSVFLVSGWTGCPAV